jgi:hypothetical protein
MSLPLEAAKATTRTHFIGLKTRTSEKHPLFHLALAVPKLTSGRPAGKS